MDVACFHPNLDHSGAATTALIDLLTKVLAKRLWAGTWFSFKFEPQQFLVSIEAFLRCSISEPFPWTSVELSSDGITLSLGEISEIGSFW